MRIIGEYREGSLPILLIANHVSWWDGFWAVYVNDLLFGRKFHFMMLEEQLRKYWFFNYAGGFSVSKKSKSVMETLRYTADLLGDNRNLVLIFPQGAIQSMHVQRFEFEKGIERILRLIPNDIQIIFLVNLIDYGSDPKACLFMYLETYAPTGYDSAALQHAYTVFYRRCVEQQQEFVR